MQYTGAIINGRGHRSKVVMSFQQGERGGGKKVEEERWESFVSTADGGGHTLFFLFHPRHQSYMLHSVGRASSRFLRAPSSS